MADIRKLAEAHAGVYVVEKMRHLETTPDEMAQECFLVGWNACIEAVAKLCDDKCVMMRRTEAGVRFGRIYAELAMTVRMLRSESYD